MPPRKNRVSAIPLLMVSLGILLIVASLLWLSNSTGDLTQNASDVPSPVASPRIPFPDIPRVSLKDAKAAFEIKQAIFVDVRGEPYFSQGHIPGSLSITNDEVSSRKSELDQKAWIITYCT